MNPLCGNGELLSMYHGMKKPEVCDFWPSLDFACDTLCKQFDKDFTHVYLSMLTLYGEETEDKDKNWLKRAVEMDKENLKIILKEWKENELMKNPNPIAKEIMTDFHKCIKDFEEDFINGIILDYSSLSQHSERMGSDNGKDEELISLLCYFGLNYFDTVYKRVPDIEKNIEFLMEIKDTYYT